MNTKVKQFFKNLRVKIRTAARWLFCCHLKKKKRIIIWSVLGSLAGLFFILGLLVGSIGTVSPRAYGILTSDVSLRTSTTVSPSGIYFAGLGAYYNELPKPGSKFQMIFTNDQTNPTIKSYPSFTVRTSQGTLLTATMSIVGELNITDSSNYGYPIFFDKYGPNWMDYLSYKVPNIIRRTVSNLGFYAVTNQNIKTLCNELLANMDEFALTISSISLALTNGGLNLNNGTIGQQLYQKKAILNFLTETYNQLNSIDTNAIIASITSLGILAASKDSMILNSTLTTSTSWLDGLKSINSTSSDPAFIQRFLWGYFQYYYNSSFDPASTQIQYQ